MANELGNNGSAEVGGNAVAELLDFAWDEGVEIVDNSSIGDTADTHLAGSTNASGTLNCMWDVTDTTGQEACTIGASLSLDWFPQGNTSGKTQYAATVTIASIGVAVARNTVITRNFGVTVNGAITKSTIV